MEKLTQNRLKELLDYDPETGIFTHKINKGANKLKGKIAGCLNKTSGYWQIRIDNKDYRAHRLVFLYVDGYLPENGLDHKDRDRKNNRYDNLREASQTCNLRNRGVFKRNKSGITGVCWDKKSSKWRSFIKVHKLISLGCFDNKVDAAKVRWEAEVKYDFPNCNTTSSAYTYLNKLMV